MLKVDVRDFFHSIDETQVYAMFRSFGYPSLIAFEMARLSTRVLEPSATARPRDSASAYSIKSYQPRRLGVLPQGAPTSGAIANRVCRVLDERLESLAIREALVYSRYADDLTFSGGRDCSRPVLATMLTQARRVLEDEGFRMNEAKTRLFPPGAAKYVLGLLVLDDRVLLPATFKTRVDALVHATSVHGPEQVARRRGFISQIGFINHVCGSLAYAAGIEPAWEAAAGVRWQTALSSHGYALP